MRQPKKEKSPKKEKGELKKNNISLDNTKTIKTKGDKVMELYEPSPYYLN